MKYLFQFIILVIIFTTPVIYAGNLTPEEIKTVELMKKKGLIPPETDIKDINTEDIMLIQYMIKEQLGIDDINNIGNPDPRFASPERTWETYKQAMIDGDFSLLKKCHMPNAKNVEIYKEIGKEKTKEIALAMKPIELVTGDENSAKYRIKREENGQDITYFISFNNIFGEWKIDQF